MNFKKPIVILLIAAFISVDFFGLIGQVKAESSVSGNAALTPAVPGLNNWMIVPAMPAVPVIIVKDIEDNSVEAAKNGIIGAILSLAEPFVKKSFVSDWKGLLNDVPLDMSKKYIDANISAYARPEFQPVLRPYFQNIPNSAQVGGQSLTPTISTQKLNSFSFSDSDGWDTWFKLMENPQNNVYGAWTEANYLVDMEADQQSQSLDKSAMAGNGMLNPLKATCAASSNGICVSWNYTERIPNIMVNRVLEEITKGRFEMLYGSQSLAGLIIAMLSQAGIIWDVINGAFNWQDTLKTSINSVVQ